MVVVVEGTQAKLDTVAILVKLVDSRHSHKQEDIRRKEDIHRSKQVGMVDTKLAMVDTNQPVRQITWLYLICEREREKTKHLHFI